MSSPFGRRVRSAAAALLRAGALLSVVCLPLAAQDATGRITGRIIDTRTGQGLSDVGIQVVGAVPGAATASGAMSGIDGRFNIGRVRAGTVTLHVRRLGYQPKTVTGLMVPANGVIEQDVTLDPATIQLGAVTVSAEAERGTVNEALDQQKNAAGIVNAVTSEQISRSPDGDAAQAVQRVSGVTVQDGKYVFVRGLGERYTTTSLNGARLPSPEPERKVVPLDLFPSGVLQTITTAKTFTPDLPGDFSGASIDIRTREFPARRQYTFSSAIGYGMGGASVVPVASGVGGERFAMAGSARGLPEPVREAGDLSSLSQPERNQLIRSFRNVWQAGVRDPAPNTSFSTSVGGNDPVFGQRIGYLGSASYSYSQEVRSNEFRALARPGNAGEQVEYNRFSGTTGRQSAMVGGLLNLSTLVGTGSRFAWNNTYNRTSDNDARLESGLYEDFGGVPLTIQRLDYVERSIWSSQLAGEHRFGATGLNWAVTGSGVDRRQPDRSEFVYESAGGRQLWVNTLAEGAVRTFSELGETAAEGKLDLERRFGSGEVNRIKVGAVARTSSRDADTRSYGIYAPVLSDELRATPPEQLFEEHAQAESNVLAIRSLAQGGSYSARDQLGAGYAMLDFGLGDRIRVIGGARVERSHVTVSAVNTLGDPTVSERTFTDVLPALAVTVSPTPAQNVRLSLSRTLARPEYRELAGIRTRDVLGGVDLRGNPDLERTLISNADVRWELYPSPGEVVSVGLFAKSFDRPIERVFRPSNTNSLIELVNAESAFNLGVELELRKRLGFVSESLEDVAFFSNVTVMQSEIALGESSGGSVTANRAMVGQAPHVVNTGLTWSPMRRAGTSATVLFNRVGERIVNAGELPLPDVKELPRNMLDLSLRVPVRGSVSLRFDARNLLDAPHEIRQGAITREYHEAGRTIQLGVSWSQ